MELGGFGREYRAMILFAGYVGLRPGELFALRRDDLGGAPVPDRAQPVENWQDRAY